ncbi:export ABC transporter ATP-binding protein, partial [Bacillus sp. PIC28]
VQIEENVIKVNSDAGLNNLNKIIQHCINHDIEIR